MPLIAMQRRDAVHAAGMGRRECAQTGRVRDMLQRRLCTHSMS
jgi:hypothetical protein